jgi:hypothetical protein
MKEWTAFRSADYGYTRMTAHNATHLELEQVSDDKVCTALKLYICCEKWTKVEQTFKLVV